MPRVPGAGATARQEGRGAMSTDLTQRQEAYVRGLVSGLSQRKAYRAAYDCPHASDSTVDPKACRLFARADVRARYDALVTEVAREAQWDRLRAARELLDVIEGAMRKIQESDRSSDIPRNASEAVIGAVRELNKMFGLYDAPDDDADVVTIVDNIPR